MQHLLFLVPLFPLVSSIVLLLLAGRLSPMLVALLGVGSMGLAAILTLLIGIEFIDMGGESFQQVLFNWLPIAGAPINFGLHLDQLSLVMMAVTAATRPSSACARRWAPACRATLAHARHVRRGRTGPPRVPWTSRSASRARVVPLAPPRAPPSAT